MPRAAAKATISSAGPYARTPRCRSIWPHFISYSAVTSSKWCAAAAAYSGSVRSRLACRAAPTCRPVAAAAIRSASTWTAVGVAGSGGVGAPGPSEPQAHATSARTDRSD